MEGNQNYSLMHRTTNEQTETRVRTIFSVENSRCFQGIFKDKFKNFKVKVPKHEISNFDQKLTIRERLRNFLLGVEEFLWIKYRNAYKLTKVKEIWGKEIEKLIQKEVWMKDPMITLLQIFCKDYTAVIIMQT